MSNWQSCDKEGVVVFSRGSESPYQISLNKGDKVNVTAESGGWYKVLFETFDRITFQKTTITGIYPSNHILIEGEAVVEKQDRKKFQEVRQVGTFEEVFTYSSSPIASEVLQVLKEWGNELKKFKKEKRDREYESIKRLMATLVGLRKRILDVRFQKNSGKSEKEEMYDKVIKVIEEGSRQLNLDLIVRITQGKNKGQRASEGNTPIVELFKQYQSLQRREEEVKSRLKKIKSATSVGAASGNATSGPNATAATPATVVTPESSLEKENEEIQILKSTYNLPAIPKIQLLLEVKACIFTVGENTELYISLYSRRHKRFVSEEFMVELTALGMPKDERLISNIFTIFRDMTEKDYLSDLYIVFKIYRKGKIVLENMGKMLSTRDLMKNAMGDSGFRRPFGVAVFELTPQIISEFLMDGKEFSPSNKLALFQPVQENNFSTLHETLVHGSGTNFERIPSSIADGIAIGLTLIQSSFQSALDENPKLQSVAETKMIEFPEVIPPTDMRNDYYLTLTSGNIPDARNVQVSCRVILKNDTSGKPVSCIKRYTALSTKAEDVYESTLYYHVHAPIWNEMFKLDLPPNDLENAILLLVVSHCSNKRSRVEPFGFGVFSLESGGVLKPDDKLYKIELYKYVKDVEKNAMHYVDDISKLTSIKSQLYVKPKLVSTRATQDAHLNNLLKWKSKINLISLEQLLDQYTYINNADIVKYLREIFNALFTILVHHDTEQVAEQVYKAILRTVDSLSKKQFSKYRVVIDEYIENCFNFPEAYKWLLNCSCKYLDFNENDKKQAKVLSQSLTSFHFLFRFIVVSRLQYESKAEDGGKGNREDFLEKTRRLFKSINRVMAINNNTSLIAAQDQTLKLISNLFDFPTISKIFPGEEFGHIAKAFIDVIPNTGRKNTIDGKLTVLGAIARGFVIRMAESRMIVLPTIVAQLKNHFSQSLSEQKQCTRVFAELLCTFQRMILEGVETVDTLRLPLQELMHTVPEAVAAMKVFKREKDEMLVKVVRAKESIENSQERLQEIEALQKDIEKLEEIRGELLSCMICLFHIMDLKLLSQYLEDKQGMSNNETSTMMDLDKQTLVLDLLYSIENIIEDSPIPEYWIAYNTFVFNVLLRMIDVLFNYCRERHSSAETFNYDIWNRLFQVSIQFMHANRLQVENFTSSKQNKIISVHGDMRVSMIKSFSEAWESLDELQMNFVPQLVKPVFGLANIAKKEIFLAALNIYCTLIEREFKNTRSVKQCEGVTVVVLDDYIVRELIDDRFKEIFLNVLEERFKKDNEISKEGMRFLNQIKNLMDLIAAVQKYNDIEEEEKTNALLRVMEYVLSSGREELFFKYAHMLARTHENNNNFVEAGIALMLHCDKLSFDSDKTLPRFSEEFPEEPEPVRKEKLYMKCIDYFDKGKNWELAIKLIRELSPIFEKQTFEYKKLGYLLKRNGELFEKIANQKRFYNSYFYTAYYGKGFKDVGLMNKEYIYKGNEAERLMDFVERIMKRFPNAEMLKPMEKPSKEVIESEGQYIQIMTVYPCSFADLKSKLAAKERNVKLSSNIASYSDHNDIEIFNYTKTFRKHPKDKQMNEQRDLYTTIFCHFINPFDEIKHSDIVKLIDQEEEVQPNKKETSESEDEDLVMDTFAPRSFPTIVRRKEIMKKLNITLSPIENAVKNIEDKNAELMDLIISHNLDAKPDTNKLSMLLNGVIDAAVMGGVAKYLEAFFDDQYLQENPHDLENLKRFQKALQSQLDTLEKGLECYRIHGKATTQKHVEHLKGLYDNMKKQLREPISRQFSIKQ